MILHKNIRIEGVVQGVGYRYACMKKAIDTGIRGFVKNMTDGSVYIEAEGSELQLKQFVGWCEKGPRFAEVRRIEVNNGELKSFKSFEVFH